jgi:hypothetical protein
MNVVEVVGGSEPISAVDSPLLAPRYIARLQITSIANPFGCHLKASCWKQLPFAHRE